MTDASRRLASLVAAFAPGRAAALVSRLGDPLADARGEALRLASASRAERLRALAAALQAGPARGPSAGPSHPLLVRLARERAASRVDARRAEAAARTAVRPADARAAARGAKIEEIPATRCWHAPWRRRTP